MTFSTLKDNRVTDRFILARLEPGRYVNDDLSASGNLYSMTFPYPVSKVERNGTELTNDGATPNSDGEWLYTESTNTLEIYSTSAPSSSVIFVVYYYIFSTNRKSRQVAEDPESAVSASNPLREWEPTIDTAPRIRQSVKNVLEGVFSIDSTTLELNTANNDFQKYLTDDDSFNEKNCLIWICIDSTDNIQKVYQGKIKSVRVDNQKATLNIYDTFSRLDQPCLMGDSADEAYYTESGFANVDPQKKDIPCPFILGPWSRFERNLNYQSFDIQANGTFNGEVDQDFYMFHDKLNEGVCIDFVDDPQLTTNSRVWGLCRAKGFRDINFATPNAVTSEQFRLDLSYSVSEWANLDVMVGDPIIVDDGAGNETEGNVFQIDAANRKLIIDHGARTATYNLGNLNIQDIGAAPYVVLKNDDKSAPASSETGLYFPRYGKHYTHTVTTTSGGNKFLKVTFTSDLEAHLHPSKWKLYYRARVDNSQSNHADIVKDMCQDVGLAVNSASFTTAESALGADIYMSIPQFDEQEYKTYREYLQLILRSTLGVLYLNNSFEVEYSLLSSPTSSDSLDDKIYLRDSLRIEVDYKDLITSLIAYNPHNADQSELVYTESSSTTVTSTKAKHLHGIDKPSRFRHVLNDISNRLQDILDVRSSRSATYRFKTATRNLDSEIGDDLQLESAVLLGQASSRDLKILSLDKSLNDTEVEASDLGDL